MKSLCAILALVAVSCPAIPASAQKITDVSRDRLLGPVHTMQVELAEFTTRDGKEVQLWKRIHQKVVYDRRGNEMERVNFDEGSIRNRTVHTTDARGRPSGWEDYEPIPGGKGERLTSRGKWLYDRKGNRIEQRTYSGKVLTMRILTKYNAAGLIIEETRIADEGKHIETMKYSYDSKGHRTKTVANTNGWTELIEESHDAAGNLLSYKTSHGWSASIYDANGRVIERNSEDAHSTSKVMTSYDDKGRVLRRVTQFSYKRPNISMSHAPKPGTVEFSYHESGKSEEERSYSPEGRLQSRIVREYDGDRRVRSQTYFDNNGSATDKVIYEYDKWGNYIKKVNLSSYPNGRPSTHIEYRSITYHQEK